MDIAGLISDFAQGNYTVTRQKRGPYVNGKYVEGTKSTFVINASVQPAAGRDLLRLPEARRTKETRILYTPTFLTAGGQDSTVQADLVSIGGVQWEVQTSENWAQPGEMASFFKCIVQSAAV